MFQELISTIKSTDLEDYGTLFLSHSEWIDETKQLILYIKITIDEKPEFSRDWKITCTNVREQRVIFGYCYGIDFTDDHVLLWQHTKPQCSVSFNGKTNNPHEIVGKLYETHIKKVDTWIPFYQFLNELVDIVELIRGGFGLLANAPEPLALAYENTLKDCGISASHGQPWIPNYWNGEEWTNKGFPPLSILVFDDSYVIAEKFEAQQV
jgi:hypothetical protein